MREKAEVHNVEDYFHIHHNVSLAILFQLAPSMQVHTGRKSSPHSFTNFSSAVLPFSVQQFLQHNYS